MKFRNGFVSNSSSSSFVVVGFEVDEKRFSRKDYLIKLFGLEESEIPRDEDDIANLLYETQQDYDCDELFLAFHDESGATKGQHLIGILVDESDENLNELNDKSFDLNELIYRVKSFRDDLGAEDAKIILKTGVRVC